MSCDHCSSCLEHVPAPQEGCTSPCCPHEAFACEVWLIGTCWAQMFSFLRAALLAQIMNLTPAQIELLPEQQKQQVIALQAQMVRFPVFDSTF